MTVLAKLRRAARPLATLIAVLATLIATNLVATNAFAVAAHAKASTGSHCQSEHSHSEHMSLADQPQSTALSDDSTSAHKGCCKSDCECPFSTGVYALSLLPFYLMAPTSSNAHFPPVLPLEDRRPSDLLRPPI